MSQFKDSPKKRDGERKNWSTLSNQEKQQTRELVKAWLHKNYFPSSTTCIPRQLVYQHFKSFCKKSLNIKRDKGTFGRLIAYIYPHVQYRRLGCRGKSKYYYHGLDALESNSHHDQIKTAKIESNKAISIPIDLQPDENNSEKSETIIHDCPGDCSACRLKWKTTDESQKEQHRNASMEWLGQNYEICPQICLLRQTVFDHYRKYCAANNQVPAPPSIFGRILLKKFSRLTMRRLGPRGNSKYYYMGIDVLEDCSDYTTICDGRIECPGGKPKSSRVQLVTWNSKHP